MQDRGESVEGNVVVVESDPTVRRLVATWVEELGVHVETRARASELEEDEVFDVVILEWRSTLPRWPRLPRIISVAPLVEPDLIARARSAGYDDVLAKPLEPERTKLAVERALHAAAVERRLATVEGRQSDLHRAEHWVFGTPNVRELVRQTERCAASDVSVLIHGEPGSGKDVVARMVHAASPRSTQPFVAVNLAAIPPQLHEIELFGREPQPSDRLGEAYRGRVELARGGTLYLDEVASLSPRAQASLARAIFDRASRRVGGAEELPMDVRFIASSTRELESEVRAGTFREELHHALVGYPIRVPPLRERRDDIPALVTRFIRDEGSVRSVAPAAMDALMRYSWPGNIRQLESMLRRALLAVEGGPLELLHLPRELEQGEPRETEDEEQAILPLEELERRAIRKALNVTKGSVERAAKLLGMGRATLYRRLAKYDSMAGPLIED